MSQQQDHVRQTSLMQPGTPATGCKPLLSHSHVQLPAGSAITPGADLSQTASCAVVKEASTWLVGRVTAGMAGVMLGRDRCICASMHGADLSVNAGAEPCVRKPCV